MAKVIAIVLINLLVMVSNTIAQTNDHAMAIDGKFGLSIFSDGIGTGLLFGGGLDIPVQPKSLFIRPELNITTHSSTPVEIAGVLKYNLPSTQNDQTTLYADGGFGLWFMTHGPYFGLNFGGGAIFPLQNSQLKIPAEIRFGPIFYSGSTIFQIALTTGIRFDLPK